MTEVSSVAPTLGTMIGLGVGIDYSLFIVKRYRERLADGVEPSEAIAALGRDVRAAPSSSPAARW